MTDAQRKDLREAAQQSVRAITRRAIILRNSGAWTDEQFRMFEEAYVALNVNATIEAVLDGFDPRCDVERAIGEIEPIANILRSFSVNPAMRSAIARVERAVQALRGTKS